MRGALLRSSADAVTVSRVLLLPVLVWTAELARTRAEAGDAAAGERLLVLAVLLAIGASDVLDGWLARRSGLPPTKRGAILDAAADRLVQWTGVGYFTFRAAPAFFALPLWLAATLVLRDALLLGVWLRTRRVRTTPFEHELHGKAATVTIFLALLATVAGAAPFATWVVALAAGVAIAYSAARYAQRLVRPAAAA